MNEVVFKTLKQKDFIVKSFVLKVATELNLSLSDTILLIYLSNQEVPILDVDNIVLTDFYLFLFSKSLCLWSRTNVEADDNCI